MARSFFIAQLFLGVFFCIFSAGAVNTEVTNEHTFDIGKVQQALKIAENDTVQSNGKKSFEQNDKMQSPYRLTNVSYSGLIVKIVLYLILISVLLIGLKWIFKRYRQSTLNTAGSGSMDVIETLSLGQNKSLVLVRVSNSVLLLAQSSTTISVLEKIDGQQAVELIASTRSGPSIQQFRDVLNTFLGKFKNSNQNA